MRTFISFLFSTLLLISFSFNSYSQKGYEIKVKITGVKDTTLILGHHYGNAMYPDDTIRVNKNGAGVFKGKKPLDQGMYIIFLPTKNYFDFIVGENQSFSIENDTTDLFKKIKFTNSLENKIFYEYQYMLSDKRDEVKNLQEQKKAAKTDAEKDVVAKKLKEIDTQIKEYTKKIISENPTLFVGRFIKATQDIEVPDPPKDANGKVLDSLFQYYYYRHHYFDNFDISDYRMLHTPLYENKIMNYIDKIVPQIPDSINPEIDKLIAKSRSHPNLFKYMLITLFSHYGNSQIMGFDGIALYIADKYYLKEATWSDSTYLRKLKEQVEKRLPLVIGKTAPDAQLVFIPAEHFIMAADSSKEFKRNPYVGDFFNISQIKAKYTILYFWEADCGHCKKATPIMYAVYKKLKEKDVQVIAISTLFGEDGKEKWVNYINENKFYDWINAWNPYDYKFKEKYDISSTPQIYILDQNKKIIAKRIGPEQCEEIINHFIELGNKK